MNFKFYQLFRSLKEELGLEGAKKIFPEYERQFLTKWRKKTKLTSQKS